MRSDKLTSTARHVAAVKRFGVWGRAGKPSNVRGALAVKVDTTPRLAARKGGK